MKKQFTITDYIVSHFVANDKYRKSLNQAYNVEGTICASDAHALLMVPESACGKVYAVKDGDKNPPDFLRVLNDNIKNTKSPQTMRIEEVLPCLDRIKIKLMSNEENCEKCDGSGQLTCEHCDSEYECDECRGEGIFRSPAKILIRDVYFTDEDGEEIRNISIGAVRFNPKFLELVLLAMAVSGHTECAFYECPTSGVFIFGHYKILVMGMAV